MIQKKKEKEEGEELGAGCCDEAGQSAVQAVVTRLSLVSSGEEMDQRENRGNTQGLWGSSVTRNAQAAPRQSRILEQSTNGYTAEGREKGRDEWKALKQIHCHM